MNRPRWIYFFQISRLKSLNEVLIPGEKLDGHRGTWAAEKKYLLQQKSAPQWQIYRGEEIPEFFYPFKYFSILILL